MIFSTYRKWPDTLGIFSAILCILHCLTMPILLTIGLGFLENPIVAGLFIGIASFSVLKATNRSLKLSHYKLLWFSLIGFITCLVLEEKSIFFKYSMYLFSTLMIFGHVYNLYKKSSR